MTINFNTLAIVGLRAAGLAVSLSGEASNTQKTSQSLYLLADLLEAGKATDTHMAAVAEKLKNREITQEDWDDVFARITADSARLQSS
ncbi:MAG: hypothetical protein FWH56_08640 [Betaproteobacteria bacterium]|nr:hypothetical protein [Betaproteobacteria bacterium]